MSSHRTGRSIGTTFARAMLGAMLLAISGTGAILAVEPGEDPAEPPPLPAGVTADATVTVTFLKPAEAGGDPIIGADVTLAVTRSGEVIQWFAGQTDASGVATFDGVARATDGGDPTLATAFGSVYGPITEPPDGECTTVDGWSGSSIEVEVASTTTLAIEAVAESYEYCSGGGGGTGEVPEGVLADASLTITVLDELGVTLPGASVSITATTDGEAGMFWKAYAEADENGVATFADLPRPDDGGPAVIWLVDVSHLTMDAVDGCALQVYRTGSASLEAVAGHTDAEVTTAAGESFGECADPGEGAPILHGVVLGPDGQPLAGAHGSVRMVRADGASWILYDFVTGEDGTFDVAIHAWGTDEAPAQLQVEVRGETTRTEPGEPCDTAFGLVATFDATVALEAGGEPDPIELNAAEAELGVLCPETPGSEAGSGDGDDRSDPPTDTEELGALASIEFWRALIILTAAVIATLAVALAPRRSTPIRVRRDDRAD